MSVAEEFIILPEYFNYDGKRYYVAGIDPSGRLKYDVVAEIKPEEELARIIAEGIEHGVFRGPASVSANPDGTVLRSEFIFELWRRLGKSQEVDVPEELTGIVGEDTYYRSAVEWMSVKGGDNVEGLYNFRDLEGPITWLEVAYLLWVFGIRGETPWSKVATNGMRTSVVSIRDANGKESLDIRLASYKQSLWMSPYLSQIATGKKYIPFPVFCMFRSMVDDLGIHASTEDKPIRVDGELKVQKGIDARKSDWCISEVSRKDMALLLERIQ